MNCRVLPTPHGAVMVCGPRTRAKFCSVCGRRGAGLLCDGKAAKKSGTCDAALCSRCARSKPDPLRAGETLDLCPRCARAGPQPVQLALGDFAMNDLFGEPLINTVPLDGDKGREERGAFFTPDQLALALAATVEKFLLPLQVKYRPTPISILEPGCGGGSFLRAAEQIWSPRTLYGVDLLPACSGPGLVEQRDLFTVTRADASTSSGFDLVLGNPDFAIAERVVRHSLSIVAPDRFVAFLLRCGFEMSQERIALFEQFPLRARASIPQRPSFYGTGNDRYDYALFVWQQGFRGRGEILPPVMYR